MSNIWSTTLDQLKLQMPAAMFGNLQGSQLLDARNGTYKVAVTCETHRQWAENRLRPTILRTMNAFAETPIDEIEFVVREPTPAPSVPLPGQAARRIAPVADPEPVFDFSAINYRDLFFLKSGFLPVSHYHTTFWQPYLNQMNGRAYNLWYTLQTMDRRNILKGRMSWWTPPLRVSLRELAGVLGANTAYLTGRMIECGCNRQARERGEPLAECCGGHCPSRWDGEGADRKCKHWKEGAIEVLQREGVMLVHKPSRKRQNAKLLVQVWRLLPLLLPAQIDRLSVVIQLRHEQWIRDYSQIGGFTGDMWEQLTDSLLDGMTGYASGQKIANDYRPNPFGTNDL